MEKHEAEALLMESLYETGAISRSKKAFVFLLLNRSDSNLIAMVRIFVDESEMDEHASLAAMAYSVAICSFDFSPQITGVSIWIFVGGSDGYDRRFASMTRDEFDAKQPIKVTARLKNIAQVIRAILNPEDQFSVLMNDLNYMKFELGIRLRLSEKSGELTEESLKRIVSEVFKAILEREPLVSRIGVSMFPQNLGARMDCLDAQNKFDPEEIAFEPLPEAVFRMRHGNKGVSG